MIEFLLVDLYNISVVFMLNPTRIEFEMMYYDNTKRVTDDEYKQISKDIFNNDNCGGFTLPLDCGDIVLCVKNPYSEEYVAHEILHVANRILLKRGVVADFDNDEAQAYLVGYLTRKYYEYLAKYTKQQNKNDE